MINPLDINQKHPCFSAEAAHSNARIHLPVAMHCNISCNYCNRRYDCRNESRPGVTSAMISPQEGLRRFQHYKKHLDNLSVVGIAGPGDALADWRESRETMRLIREYDPDVLLCLSTNGLKLPDLAPEIVELGVSHVTVTVNTLNPETGARIYRHVNYKGNKYEGTEAAGLLLNNQLAGIRYLTEHDIIVKINTVMIPGINENDISDVVHKMKELGAFISNIMPLIPVKGTVFEDLPATNPHDLALMRRTCQTEMRQMFHCQQCRSDAVGLLKEHRCGITRGKQAV